MHLVKMQRFVGALAAYETLDTFLNDYKVTSECLKVSDDSLEYRMAMAVLRQRPRRRIFSSDMPSLFACVALPNMQMWKAKSLTLRPH